MRKSSSAIMIGLSFMVLTDPSWAQSQAAPQLGAIGSNPASRASLVGGASPNDVKLNAAPSDLGLAQPVSPSSLTTALDGRDHAGGINVNARLGEGSAPSDGDIKLLASPHSSGNLASELGSAGGPGAKSASLTEGGQRIDNRNAAALMGGNTLTGMGTPLKAMGGLTNALK